MRLNTGCRFPYEAEVSPQGSVKNFVISFLLTAEQIAA